MNTHIWLKKKWVLSVGGLLLIRIFSIICWKILTCNDITMLQNYFVSQLRVLYFFPHVPCNHSCIYSCSVIYIASSKEWQLKQSFRFIWELIKNVFVSLWYIFWLILSKIPQKSLGIIRLTCLIYKIWVLQELFACKFIYMFKIIF